MFAVVAQQGFYEAAAQVIPILILVLVIGEARIFRATDEDVPTWRANVLVSLVPVVALVLGEMMALRALIDGHDSSLLFGGTTLALLLGFTFLLAGATLSLLGDRRAETSPQRRRAQSRFLVATALAVSVASAAILSPAAFGN